MGKVCRFTPRKDPFDEGDGFLVERAASDYVFGLVRSGQLTHRDFLVYMVLCAAAQAPGCVPTVGFLARRAGRVSRRTIYRVVSRLKKASLVRQEGKLYYVTWGPPSCAR